jgi:transcriptional regulator with XRE-family HTH domain
MARTKFLITEPVDYSKLAREFAQLRTLAELSQREVSKACGISPSQYGRLERGELLDRPSFEDITRVCRFYNIEPNRAANLMGLWPVKDIEQVEADSRIKAIIGFIAQMPLFKREGFIELFYRSAVANAAEEEPNNNHRRK